MGERLEGDPRLPRQGCRQGAPTPSPCTRGCSRSAPPRPPLPWAPRGWRAPQEPPDLPAPRASRPSGAGWEGRRRLSGPPEGTISIPTRTFRAGSRQRRALASTVVALLLISVIAVGAWALFDPTAGGGAGPINATPNPPQGDTRSTPGPTGRTRLGGRGAMGPPRADTSRSRRSPGRGGAGGVRHVL